MLLCEALAGTGHRLMAGLIGQARRQIGLSVLVLDCLTEEPAEEVELHVNEISHGSRYAGMPILIVSSGTSSRNVRCSESQIERRLDQLLLVSSRRPEWWMDETRARRDPVEPPRAS